MRPNSLTALACAVVILAAPHAVTAQKRDTLPAGRPFQIIEQTLATLEATMRARVVALETQLAANAADDAARAELIGTLQALMISYEARLAGTEGAVGAVAGYMGAMDGVLHYQGQRLATLQNAVAVDSGSLRALFTLFTEQQAAVAGLERSLEWLASRSDVQQERVLELQQQLTMLTSQYQATRIALQNGCPANYSIRQVLGGSVVCEPHDGAVSVQEITGPSPGVIAAGAVATRDAACPAGTPPFVATGGGYVASQPVAVLSSSRNGNGWRVVVQNTSATVVTVTAKVECLRLQ